MLTSWTTHTQDYLEDGPHSQTSMFGGSLVSLSVHLLTIKQVVVHFLILTGRGDEYYQVGENSVKQEHSRGEETSSHPTMSSEPYLAAQPQRDTTLGDILVYPRQSHVSKDRISSLKCHTPLPAPSLPGAPIACHLLLHGSFN